MLSPLNVGGLVTYEMDKTEFHILSTLRAYIMCFFLAETRMCQYQLPSIGNFHVHPVSRSVARHINRCFGGFCILCKHDIFPNIKVLKNSCHDFHWIQIDKQHYS